MGCLHGGRHLRFLSRRLDNKLEIILFDVTRRTTATGGKCNVLAGVSLLLLRGRPTNMELPVRHEGRVRSEELGKRVGVGFVVRCQPGMVVTPVRVFFLVNLPPWDRFFRRVLSQYFSTCS